VPSGAVWKKRGSPSNLLPEFLNAGETALVVEFGKTVDPRLHDEVLALDAALAAASVDGVVETVPTYRSLMVHYDPRKLDREALAERIETLLERSDKPALTPAKRSVPVCYEPPYAEDLPALAQALGIDEARVVALFGAATYRLYMYGFLPGFAYLGKLPKELEIPRRATPRPPVPPGAILVVGEQVVIAGVAMQTGWYMIGRTPLRLFDLERDPPFSFAVGDEVTFEPIAAADFA